jgi:hypothetical protein
MDFLPDGSADIYLGLRRQFGLGIGLPSRLETASR